MFLCNATIIVKKETGVKKHYCTEYNLNYAESRNEYNGKTAFDQIMSPVKFFGLKMHRKIDLFWWFIHNVIWEVEQKNFIRGMNITLLFCFATKLVILLFYVQSVILMQILCCIFMIQTLLNIYDLQKEWRNMKIRFYIYFCKV